MRSAAIGLALLVCVVAPTACAKSTAPTRAQYVAVADQVCSAAIDRLADDIKVFDKENGPNPDAGDRQRFVRFVLLKDLRGTVNQLRMIAPPADDGQYLASMYNDADHTLKLSFSDPLGRSADEATSASGGRLQAYGMAKCAQMRADAAVKARKLAAEDAKSGTKTSTKSEATPAG